VITPEAACMSINSSRTYLLVILFIFLFLNNNPIGQTRLNAQADITDQLTPSNSHVILDIVHQPQYKDTYMVCIDGCERFGDYPWDGPHPYGDLNSTHSASYCLIACLSMVACRDGNSLSQDRIAYYIYEELGANGLGAVETGQIGNPLGDLGHDTAAFLSDCGLALNWIYGVSSGATGSQWNADIYNDPSPDIDSIVEYIDLDIPIIYNESGHGVVIDGYAEITDQYGTIEYIHILDPELAGPSENDPHTGDWHEFLPTMDSEFLAPPVSGAPVLSDELTVNLDNDNDGLVNFDETERFGTDPENPDSDGDGILDGIEVASYTFNRDGEFSQRNPDIDNDGDWKQNDIDNDNNSNSGSPDGCEDSDLDGFLTPDSRETSNFDYEDDFTNINPSCLRGIIRFEHRINAEDFISGTGRSLPANAPIDISSIFNVHKFNEILIENDGFNSDAYVHLHRWGRALSGQTPFSHSEGADNGEGLAMVKLIHNELSGDYFLETDVDSDWDDFQWQTTTNLPLPVGPSIRPQVTEVNRPTFKNQTFPLDPPIELDGGLLFEGEVNINIELGGSDIPGVTNKLWWEIWYTLPTN